MQKILQIEKYKLKKVQFNFIPDFKMNFRRLLQSASFVYLFFFFFDQISVNNKMMNILLRIKNHNFLLFH